MDCIGTYARILDQVRNRVAQGVYNLDRWRRILHNMKPKSLPNPHSRRSILTEEALMLKKKKEGENQKKRLSNIVNKILSIKSQQVASR